MDIYSTISSPGELATYAAPKVYQNPFSSGNGGMGGLGQLEALMGKALENKMAMAAMQRKNMALDLSQRMARPPIVKTRDKEYTGPSESPFSPSYVKNISGFNQTPGVIQTGAGDPGAVFGGDWLTGSMNKGAKVMPSSGPNMPPSTLPDYGGGETGFERPDDGQRADFYGLRSRGFNQLAALRR